MVTVVEKKALYEEFMQKARRIGEAAELEAIEADQNSTISQRISRYYSRGGNSSFNFTERVWLSTT